MFRQMPTAYDRAITVFSPDGRIFQVEYAMESVKKATPAIGVTCKEGVVLAVEEKIISRLQDKGFVQKIAQIDSHIGCAAAGFGSDARILINQARIYAQSNRLLYDEPIDVEALVRRICDLKQLYTQHAGVRPFGVSLLFAGIDSKGPALFMTEPSGVYWAFKAMAIGMGSSEAKRFLEKNYREDMKLEEAIKLAIAALIIAKKGEETPSPVPLEERIKVAVIPADTKTYRELSVKEVAKYLMDARSMAARAGS